MALLERPVQRRPQKEMQVRLRLKNLKANNNINLRILVGRCQHNVTRKVCVTFHDDPMGAV